MHRWSELFIPTLREAPADAEVASHKLLVRAGYIRQLGAGIYSFLFLGNRTTQKIMGIVREEMDKIGQEFHLPALNPRELWEESGRWTAMGENMFRLKDRKGANLCLGMTHEEVMTDIARKELRSYKQLPQIWYQIQTKFRDEPRPKSGLLRVRQFMMKDAYSFDMDAAGLDASYQKHYDTYCRIFDRCGLKYMVIDAHSGAMGGSQSQEFMVRTPAGEDQVVSCEKCGYAANMEKATSKLAPIADLKPEGDGKPLLVHTPGKGAIADVAEFLQISATQDIKAVAYMAQRPGEIGGRTGGGKTEEQPVVVFLRGDHTVNETKLLTLVKAANLRPMQAEELEKYRYRLQELVKERTAELQSNNLKLAREIVDRRQAEKALAESEQKFRDIAQNVPGTIFQLRVRPDGSNYFSYLSPRAADIFELPLEQPNFEWSLSNHIHPDDRAGFLASVARVINERLDWNYEGRIVKSNGEIKWFHGFTSQNYVGDEMVLDGIMLDITERKMTEQSLKDSVKQYKALFSSMTEAFMLCEIITDKKDDPVDFRFLEMNDAWETQTGIKIEQARGKTVREVIPDVETGWIKRCGNVVKTGVPVQFEEYNVSTNRFYSIHSFKTKDNQFGAVFSAITKREKVEPSPR